MHFYVLCRYDMTISDSMYGAAKRYVTRERVEAMLDYEVRCMLCKGKLGA